MSRILFPFHQGVFFPVDKSLLTWMMMMQVLEGWGGNFHYFTGGEANIHYAADKSFCTQYGTGPEADNLARTSFIWGKKTLLLGVWNFTGATPSIIFKEGQTSRRPTQPTQRKS